MVRLSNIPLGIMIMILGIAICVPIYSNIGYSKPVKEYIHEKYPIYRCTAPFGILWIEISGEGSFFLASGSFSIDSTLSESYAVKYFDDSELKSIILEASQTSVITDGEFYLELIYWQEVQYHSDGHRRVIDDSRIDNPESIPIFDEFWHQYKIHIPFLPPVNKTISMEWTRQ